MQVLRYQTRDGRLPIADWLESMRDGSARTRIVAAIDRMQTGARGDWRSIGGGLWEIRFHYGPGYRVYFGRRGNELILLLCGGDKGTQARDIETAHEYWKDYKARTR